MLLKPWQGLQLLQLLHDGLLLCTHLVQALLQRQTVALGIEHCPAKSHNCLGHLVQGWPHLAFLGLQQPFQQAPERGTCTLLCTSMRVILLLLIRGLLLILLRLPLLLVLLLLGGLRRCGSCTLRSSTPGACGNC
jgi:hypothetical protein